MPISSINIRRRRETLENAIRNGGFYGKNGIWNAIKTFPGDKTIYRHRVETLIIKDNKFVFVKKKIDGSYRLPGGSTEKDIPNIEQAINECREEAHIDVKNIEYTGITYKEKQEPSPWAINECDILWNGKYTEVYVAEYKSKYNGVINKLDEDPFIRSGQWYTTKECFNFFRKEHREALLWFIKNHQESNEDTPVVESYLTNYFANKKLLKKISNEPEVQRDAVIQLVDLLKKKYASMSEKSNIKRERKRDDVESIFHPITSFEFPDGHSITIALCFDDSSFTDGMATHSDEYGDIIVIYPVFFKNKDIEDNIFTILHEIGHIRLNHLRSNNNRVFLNKYADNDYRRHVMRKGKVMYPEMNADLYAVLNGAAMYAILSASFDKDTDNQYDYRFTNAELAARYSGVFKQYRKLKNFKEGTAGFINFDITKYDMACSSLYDIVYLNEDTEEFSINEKDILYNILYEMTINRHIKKFPYVVKAEKEYVEASEVLLNKESLYSEYENICEIPINELTLDELNFKLDVESDVVNNIPRLENDLLSLRDRFENALDGLMYARGKAYEAYESMLEKTSCFIGPATIKNEKSVIFASEKATIERSIYDTINTLAENYHILTEATTTSEILDKYIYLVESLSKKDKDKIPTEEFGIPETRSYPLDTRKHVLSAIKLFGHCESKYRKELAENIFSAMKKFNIPEDHIGKDSPLRKYM